MREGKTEIWKPIRRRKKIEGIRDIKFLEKLKNDKDIIKKIDQDKEKPKSELGKNYKENQKTINLINDNKFDEIENSCKVDEIKQKILEYVKFCNENDYQKIQKIKKETINFFKKLKSKFKDEDFKKSMSFIESHEWDNIFNEINSIIESNIITIEHKKIKENKIN